MNVVVDMRRRRVVLDPLDSGAALELMTALAANGDVAGAIRHAQVHETLLSQQLDLPPDAQVVAFANRLKEGPPLRVNTASVSDSERSAVIEASRAVAPLATSPPRPERRRTMRTSVRWIAGAVALIGVAGVLAVTIFRGRTGATVAAAAAPSGPSSVMVAPFRVAGADPSLSYLRDGLVELLSVRLGDDPARPAVDPGLVLSRWRGAGLTDAQARPEAVRMAERLAAQTVVVGSVVGSPTSILVTASLIGVADGAIRANETVQGPADSLLAMVDRLVVRLLAADAGEGERLGAGRTPPLASLKAYLSGQAAYRQGRFAEAVRHYERAVDADSTFALAAFRLSMAADRLNVAEQHDRALAVAWKYRESLNARDQAHLVAFAGPRYPAPSSEAEQLAAWERAAGLAPDRSEVWQELGERFFYDGPVMGAATWRERASAAFRRALALDPNASMARAHLILLAARARDTVELDGLASRAAVADSVGDLAPFLSWRVALAREDAGGLRRARESLAETDATNLRWIAMSSLFDAVGPQDGERALRLMLTGPAVSDAATYANIVIARLYERLGDSRAALAAIRRRGYMSGWPRYLASATRKESRLALALGDSVAAADAYRRYLSFRQDAEPEPRRARP